MSDDRNAADLDLTPPQAVRRACARGLRLHAAGRSGDGLVPATVAWARRLAQGDAATPAKIRAMRAWHARHASDRRPGWDDPGEESPGFVAYLLWGGEPGQAWSARMGDRLDRAATSAGRPVWQVGAARSLALADPSTWDHDAATRDLLRWSGFDRDTPDPTCARRGFLISNPTAPYDRASYQLPFAVVRDDQLRASAEGIRDAAARLAAVDLDDPTRARAQHVIGQYLALADIPVLPDVAEPALPPMTGAMVALYLDAATAAQIAALPGVTQDASDLHITLCHLGMAADLSDQRAAIHACVAACAAQTPPLAGLLSGVGRFPADADEGLCATWLAVDMPGLADLRATLTAQLSAIGCTVNRADSYTPHLTISYDDPDTPLPALAAPIPLQAQALTLAWGDEYCGMPMTTPPMTDPPTNPASSPALAGAAPSERIQLRLVSAVGFADGVATPVHALRVGTFTDFHNRDFTVTPDHIRALVRNYAARQPPRASPITRNHDFGEALGRITRVWHDAAAENLYFAPWWSAAAQTLIEQRAYDGISCEIDDFADLTKIDLCGASLTNYPAVSHLLPVTLQAPPPTIDPHYRQEPAMPDATTDSSTGEIPILLEGLTELIQQQSATLSQQQLAVLETRLSQITAESQQRVEEMFARRLAALQLQQRVATFARDATTATHERPYALPTEPGQIESLMLSMTADQRAAFSALITQILRSGLVSFEEIGSAAGETETISATERYEQAVSAKVAAGFTRVQAIQQVRRDQPELVAVYNQEQQGATPRRTGGR